MLIPDALAFSFGDGGLVWLAMTRLVFTFTLRMRLRHDVQSARTPTPTKFIYTFYLSQPGGRAGKWSACRRGNVNWPLIHNSRAAPSVVHRAVLNGFGVWLYPSSDGTLRGRIEQMVSSTNDRWRHRVAVRSRLRLLFVSFEWMNILATITHLGAIESNFTYVLTATLHWTWEVCHKRSYCISIVQRRVSVTRS